MDTEIGCNCDPEGGCGCFETSEEEIVDEEEDQEYTEFS